MSTEPEKILRVQNLRVDFQTEERRVTAVDDVSFDLHAGEILGLVGESGSGKSVTGMSLLKLIPKPIGQIKSGEVHYKGRDLLQLSAAQLSAVRGKEIGIIFQEPMTALSPLKTVGDQLIETLRLHQSLSNKEAAAIAIEWLAKVGIPDPAERMHAYPFQFSGGMRQRVMIAMVLMLDPAVIIADEPTTALDVTTQRQIFELILKIRNRRSAILFITHDMGVIWQLCDRVIVMQDAKVVETGDIQTIFNQPREPYTRKLLSSVPRITDASCRNHNADTKSATEKLINIQNLKTWFPVKRGIFAQTVGYVKAVDDISLHINRGEILAVVGESGSGKTTLGRSILGLEKVTAGTIAYQGHNLAQLDRKAFKPLRQHLQIVFQDPFASLNPRMTIRDILTEGLAEHKLLEDTPNTTAERLLRAVKLKPEFMYRYPHEFSGGQRQRICIARALALKPQFIVCDEAVSALDVTVQAQVIDLLLELQAQFKLTYLFISHDLSVVKRIADRTIVMHRGKIVEQGRTEAVIHDPKADYTRTLIEAVPTPNDPQSRMSIRSSDANEPT